MENAGKNNEICEKSRKSTKSTKKHADREQIRNILEETGSTKRERAKKSTRTTTDAIKRGKRRKNTEIAKTHEKLWKARKNSEGHGKNMKDNDKVFPPSLSLPPQANVY